eukprot:3519238-Pyramimonas_sp.AAC.1
MLTEGGRRRLKGTVRRVWTLRATVWTLRTTTVCILNAGADRASTHERLRRLRRGGNVADEPQDAAGPRRLGARYILSPSATGARYGYILSHEESLGC